MSPRCYQPTRAFGTVVRMMRTGKPVKLKKVKYD